MKKMKKFGLIAFAALSIVLTSCEDTEGTGSGIELDTFVSAEVDGVAFKTFSVGDISAGSAIKSGNNVSVTGVSKTSHTATESKSITIVLTNITAAGTYTVTPASVGSRLTYFDSAADKTWDTTTCEGATGTVVVTTFNQEMIEGTFSFTAKDESNCSSQKVITSGRFKGTF